MKLFLFIAICLLTASTYAATCATQSTVNNGHVIFKLDTLDYSYYLSCETTPQYLSTNLEYFSSSLFIYYNSESEYYNRNLSIIGQVITPSSAVRITNVCIQKAAKGFEIIIEADEKGFGAQAYYTSNCSGHISSTINGHFQAIERAVIENSTINYTLRGQDYVAPLKIIDSNL